MIGTPRKGDKSTNFTMMASFRQVIVSKNEQTNREKYVFYCSVSQIHINPKKKHEKPLKMTFCDIHINIIY